MWKGSQERKSRNVPVLSPSFYRHVPQQRWKIEVCYVFLNVLLNLVKMVPMKPCWSMWSMQSHLMLCQSFFFFFLTSRALFTYEGNSNDVRLADKGGECLLGFFCFLGSQHDKKKSEQEFHHQHKAAALESLHKRIACLCSPVLSSVKGKISTVTQSTTVTIWNFPLLPCIRWRTRRAGRGAEQWQSDVRFLPSQRSQLRSAEKCAH